MTQACEEPIIELLDDVEATGYDIDVSLPDSEMRLRMFSGNEAVLSEFICSASDAYELAHRILRAYDRLENIE